MEKRIVDLSGFMFSGKSAVGDLLREFDRFYVPHYQAEFDLLRISGGLIDLKNAVMDWSPIRTHAALRRFERVVAMMASTPKFPAKFFTTGFGYLRRYPNLLAASRGFVEEIVELSWRTPWPYDDLDDAKLATFVRKLRLRAGLQTYRDYRMVSRSRFMPAAQRFVTSILWYGLDPSRYDTVITNNALEPFNPGANLELLGPGAKCIVIDRDPRDIYATAITVQPGYNDNVNLYKPIAGAHDVDAFIRRYKIYRDACARTESGVLRIRFEDVISRYPESLERILAFLGIPAEQHTSPGRFLRREESKKNVGLWKSDALKDHSHEFSRIADACCA